MGEVSVKIQLNFQSHTPFINHLSSTIKRYKNLASLKERTLRYLSLVFLSDNVADEAVHKELSDSLVRAATTASSLEVEQDKESLGEDASKQGRIDAIDADEEITLVSVHDMNVSAGEEVVEEVVEVINTAKLIIDAAQVSAAGDKVTLEEIKSTKPKQKGVVIQELGKGILIEPVKKKDQILLDEETALNLQVEFDEEERLAREKAEKE
ncbi:hypothetical protein Tco_1334652 [Tanacetum coccineum]